MKRKKFYYMQSFMSFSIASLGGKVHKERIKSFIKDLCYLSSLKTKKNNDGNLLWSFSNIRGKKAAKRI